MNPDLAPLFQRVDLRPGRLECFTFAFDGAARDTNEISLRGKLQKFIK